MKKVCLIIIITLFLIITNVMTGIYAYKAGMFISASKIANLNLTHSEQIKFLSSSFSHRLLQKDKQLEKDISDFDKGYKISYESQPFKELVKKYFPNEYKEYKFIYQDCKNSEAPERVQRVPCDKSN